MADLTQQFSLGPCTATFNSIDLGHTDESGIKVTRKVTLVTTTANKFGKTPTNILYDGEEITVEGTFVQTNFAIIAAAFPGVTTVTGSGKTRLTFGKSAGSLLTGHLLKIQSVIAANDPTYQFNMPKAVPVGDIELIYSGGQFQGFKVKFTGLVSESATDGNYVASFGDLTATADAVAPTVSSIVPADNATGISTSTTITATLSKALDGNTVNTNSVYLFKAPESVGPTGLKVTGTVVLTNNGSSTTIVFTPGSALTSAATYEFVLTDAIKDTAGNSLAFYVSNFTCA